MFSLILIRYNEFTSHRLAGAHAPHTCARVKLSCIILSRVNLIGVSMSPDVGWSVVYTTEMYSSHGCAFCQAMLSRSHNGEANISLAVIYKAQ